jgi:hypothetical protein
MLHTDLIFELAADLVSAGEELLVGRVAAHFGKTGELMLLEVMVKHGLLRLDGDGIVRRIED